MKKTINVLVIAGCFISLAVIGYANEFLFYKQLTAPKDMKNEVGAAIFDSQMYFNADDSFANLRIYDAENNEVPYVVRKLRGQDKKTQESAVRMKVLSLRELSDNRLSITVKRADEDRKRKEDEEEEDIVPNEVTIKTLNNNFEKTVSVFGSDDQKQWHLLGKNQPIFDYSRFIDLRNTSVSFEKKSFKYYKVIIDNAAQALISSFSQIFTKYAKGKVQEKYSQSMRDEGILHIKRLEFISREEKPVYGDKKIITYPLDITDMKVNKKDKTTDIYLKSMREPLTRMLFSIKNKNFKRKVVVEAENPLCPEPKWISFASSELFNISAGDFHKEKLNIDLPQKDNRIKKYRVRIFNYDNAPIKVSSVEAEGSAHELVFFHNNERKLKVYYGGEDFKSPNYDVSSVLAEIPIVTGEHWEVGEERTNEDAKHKQKSIISSKQLLMSVLIIMVIVLVYLITVSVKKVDEMTK